MVIEKSAAPHNGDAWRTAMDACLPVMRLIDARRSIPYGVQQIRELFGISCAFDQAVEVCLLFAFLSFFKKYITVTMVVVLLRILIDMTKRKTGSRLFCIRNFNINSTVCVHSNIPCQVFVQNRTSASEHCHPF